MAKPTDLQYIYKKLNFDIMKPTDLQYIYKKQIGFTSRQEKPQTNNSNLETL